MTNFIFRCGHYPERLMANIKKHYLEASDAEIDRLFVEDTFGKIDALEEVMNNGTD